MVSFQKLSHPRIVTSATIAIGVVLIYFGFSLAQTGDEGSNLPSAIERLSPADDDRVLRQSEIVIDFIDGFTGVLTIDGIEIRGMFMFTGKPIHSTGGAFWAFHFVHPKTKKMVCLSGYVDAPPTTSWTHPLREVQAILRSVEFVK